MLYYINSQQISNIADENYRIERAGDNYAVGSLATDTITRKKQEFSYDANGNLIFTVKGKVKDNKLQATNTRKLLWDEENRLLAISDNGFVSNYWYDAAGERTVKESFDNEGVYVNGALSGARTGPFDYRDYGLGPDQIWNSAVNGLDQIELSIIRLLAMDNFNANLIRKNLPSEYKTQFEGLDNNTLINLFQVKFVDRELSVIPKQSLLGDIADLGLSILDVAAIVAPNKTTGFIARTSEVTLSSLSKMLTGAKTLIKDAKLPTQGKIRFVPRASDIKNGKLLQKGGGYVDKFGNIWKKGTTRTKGEATEWDVQLSDQGKKQLGKYSHDGNQAHINVSLKGRITH